MREYERTACNYMGDPVTRETFLLTMSLYFENIAHRFGGFFLGGGGDVGVGVEGEACGKVTEHTADRLAGTE